MINPKSSTSFFINSNHKVRHWILFFIVHSLFIVMVLDIANKRDMLAFARLGPGLLVITFYFTYCVCCEEPIVAIFKQHIEIKPSPIAFPAFLKLDDISSCSFLRNKIVIIYHQNKRLKIPHRLFDGDSLAELKANLARLVTLEEGAKL
ncbi:hypothetical protein [Reinekea sp.]|jgi:hypothetical protein|uniref:hypothetical protein n=1 Tax=Reinekea sp. TaxID=1970455 RepID=UPI00398A1F12